MRSDCHAWVKQCIVKRFVNETRKIYLLSHCECDIHRVDTSIVLYLTVDNV